MKNEKLLRIKAVTEYVGISKPQIYKLVREGKFPKFHKLGGSTVWKLSDIQKYIETVVNG